MFLLLGKQKKKKSFDSYTRKQYYYYNFLIYSERRVPHVDGCSDPREMIFTCRANDCFNYTPSGYIETLDLKRIYIYLIHILYTIWTQVGTRFYYRKDVLYIFFLTAPAVLNYTIILYVYKYCFKPHYYAFKMYATREKIEYLIEISLCRRTDVIMKILRDTEKKCIFSRHGSEIWYIPVLERDYLNKFLKSNSAPISYLIFFFQKFNQNRYQYLALVFFFFDFY